MKAPGTELLEKTDAVIPLYSSISALKPPALVGSGILFLIGERYFLFTAAHVIEEFNTQPIITGSGKGWIEFSGESYRTALPISKSHKNDPVDAAVLSIESKIPDEMARVAITLDDVDWSELTDTDDYLIMGYPYKYVSVKNRGVHAQRFFFINVSAHADTYANLERSRNTHCLMSMPERGVTAQGITQYRALEGISGGGIWRLKSTDNADRSGSLVAVVTDHLRKHRTLIGVRLAVHIALLRKYRPECLPPQFL